MRSNPAIIHATLAVGASATAPYYDVNITQQLCSAACCDETPVFAPFKILNWFKKWVFGVVVIAIGLHHSWVYLVASYHIVSG